MMGFGTGAVTRNIHIVLAVLIVLSCSHGSIPVAWAAFPQTGFLNIDCGSNASYVDPLTGINWVPDAEYITTGRTATIANAQTAFPGFAEAGALRYFDDSRAKNCYRLPVTPNTTYLLRASFFFGNYVTAPALPSFRLAVDASVFENVTITTSSYGIYREVTYNSSQSNVTFLCLVRDSSGSVPFISAISLKPSHRYNGFGTHLASGRRIVTEMRVNFGGTDMIRYPLDPYDRYWHSQGVNSSFLRTPSPVQILTTTQPIGNSKNDSYYAPWAVLQSAVTTSSNMTLLISGPISDRVYKLSAAVLHFAELHPAANISTRQFYMSVPVGLVPAVVYENPFNYTNPPAPFMANSWFLWDLENIGPTSEIIMYPTLTSIQGPILNGMEFFSITDPIEQMTVSRDALAIEAIKLDMNLTEWTGDPCLPSPHLWVNCTMDIQSQQMQITAVNLAGYNLSGPISPSFANLESLTSLHLENNMLSGPIPVWLTSLKLLKVLSVQNNNFSGQVPPGLLSTNYLQFTYKPGNPWLIGNFSDPVPSSKSSSNIGIIVGATIGAVLGLAGLVLLVVCCCKPGAKPKNPPREKVPGSSAKAYSLGEVTAATDNFKRQIGQGGFGPVYYGRLPSGQEVAVKVADGSSHQGSSEFFNEVELMSRVHHRNLVSLLGYCQEDSNQILIYEYIELGSLHDQLYGTARNAVALDWNMRLNIALSSAQGLQYLHTGCNPCIIHRDVKSSNILLTGKADVAKVADFGISKSTGVDTKSHVSTFVKGTAGYLDPEYLSTNYLNPKSDVYSFGVVLLELMTGRSPLNFTPQAHDTGNLVEWVRVTLQAGDIYKILDPAVKASHPNLECLWKVAEIALQCVEPMRFHRSTMDEVVQELRDALLKQGLNSSSHPRGASHMHNTPDMTTNTSSFLSESEGAPSPR